MPALAGWPGAGLTKQQKEGEAEAVGRKAGRGLLAPSIVDTAGLKGVFALHDLLNSC